MKAKIITTERLILKPLSLEHLSDIYVSWLNDPIVYQYLETGGNYTLEKLRDFLTEVENKDIYFWAIHEKHSSKHVGNVKLDPIDYAVKMGEMGTMLGDKEIWSLGYGTETKRAVIEFAFKELDLNKITSGCHSDNSRIIHVNEKLGFVIEGVFRQHHFNSHRNKIVDIVRMALFSNSYVWNN